MNKRLKSISCLLAATCTFIVLENTIKLGPVGVDVVSAATETTIPVGNTGGNGGSTSSFTSNGYRILRIGSTGSDVKFLQTALNNNGSKLVVDGFFGNLTLAAVKDYQKAQGLVVDGIVGPKTMAVLVPSSAVPTAIAKVGSSNNDVKYLQTNLNKLGYKLSVDGIFGNLTLAAVKDFQKANGLVVDGIAGPKTFGKLFEKTNPTTTPTTTPPTTPTTTPDVVSSASVTDNAAVFEKSIGTTGKWIVCTTKDLTFDHAIVVDGNFTNGKIGKDAAGNSTGLKAIQRKIGLYTQLKDANGANVKDKDGNNVTDKRFTLTAPKITILSMNASIEQGIVKGDIYVSAQNFQLKGATVQGNVFFTNKGAQATFKQNDSTISGMKTLLLLPETVDAYASASKVMDEPTFETAISSTGKWIAATLNNLKFDHEIVVAGGVKKASTDAAEQRKIAIYAHDIHSSSLTTARFILEAPKMTINSANANITKGMFKGDLYISAPNFKLVDAIVDGNIYFASQAIKDSFKTDATSIITGKQEVKTN